jgi:hypothetical protein
MSHSPPRLHIRWAFTALTLITLLSFVFYYSRFSVHVAPPGRAPDRALEPAANPTPDVNPTPIPDLPTPAIPDPLAPTIPPPETTTQDLNESLMLLHQSWMEYPEAISFPGGPSLLDATNPKPLKVLFINYHQGVENEVNAVITKIAQSYNITVEVSLTRGVGNVVGYEVTDEAATAYYPLHSDHCDVSKYDLIICGDVVTYCRPYLQAACKTNIILYITNRFDFRIIWDAKYATLVSDASLWPNVRVMVNNLYEPYYARKLRQVNFHIYAYAPSTGTISPIAQNMMEESPIDWSKIAEDEFVMVDRGKTSFLIARKRTFLPHTSFPAITEVPYASQDGFWFTCHTR